MLAYTSENIVFLFIGIGTITFDLAWRKMGIILLIFSFLAIFISRAANIYSITWLLNKYRQKSKISLNY